MRDKRINDDEISDLNRKKRNKYFDYQHEANKSFIINQLENKKNPDLEKVKELLKQGNFSNLRDTKGCSILESACQNPYITLEIFQLLIDNGNPVVMFQRVIHDEKQPEVPLSIANKLLNHICCNENINLEIIQLLVEKHHADPNAIMDGLNLFYRACCHKKVTLEIIQYLLNNGVDCSRPTELLHYICRNGNTNLEIIKYFVETLKADPNKLIFYGKDLFHWICGSKTVTLEVIEYLILKGANIKDHVISSADFPDDTQYTPVSPETDLLNYLLYNGNVNAEIIKFLIEKHDADPNARVFDQMNSLYWACSNKNITIEIIKYLIDKGASIKQNVVDENQEDRASLSPATDLLHYICSNDNINLEIIRYFAENHKADLKAIVEGKNLLHWACASETVKLPTIQYLIGNGVDLKQQDENERVPTPVHLFFKKYWLNADLVLNQEISNYLLDQDIDVNATDNELQTILHLICGLQEITPMIYKIINQSESLSLTIKNEDHETPLDVAYASNNQVALILLLLLRWQDVGLTDFELEKHVIQQSHELYNLYPFCEKRKQMQGLIMAAKTSKIAFEKELDAGDYLDNFPDECLKQLALGGYLSESQLIKLKERNIFIKENIKYFPESTKKNVFTFFCYMKVFSKEKLRPGWKMPRQVLNSIVLREILHNEAQAIRVKKSKEHEENNFSLKN